MDTVIDKLRTHWHWNRLTFRSGTSPESIEEFEAKYNVTLPADLRLYHLQLDGMEESHTDNESFAFLPLSKIKSVPEELAAFAGIPNYSEITAKLPDARHCFVFVDFLILSHVYAIRLSADANTQTPVFWICGSFWKEVAPSFSRFIELYLTDINSLFA